MTDQMLAQIKAVYSADTTEGLETTHDAMVLLIQTDHQIANMPQFYEHRRALVNELTNRGKTINPILTRT